MIVFQGDSGVTPDPAPRQVGGNLFIPVRIPETHSRDRETETGSLETEQRVHRIHGTLETGLHIILRSLVAPTRGAGGYCSMVFIVFSLNVPLAYWVLTPIRGSIGAL